MALFYMYSECTKFHQEENQKGNEYITSILITKTLFYKELLEYILNEFKLGYYSYYELDHIMFLLITIIDSMVSSMKETLRLIKVKTSNLNNEQTILLENECFFFENLSLNYTSLLFLIRHFKDEDMLKFRDSRKKEKIRNQSRFKNLEFFKYIIREEEFEYFMKNISRSMQNKKDLKNINSCENELKKSEEFIKTKKESHPKEVEGILKSIISNKLFINKVKKLSNTEKVALNYEFKFLKERYPIPIIGIISTNKKN